ncbi:tripartite tricarboxylate transporter substrate binding protein [Roseococcus suduntuyensis]|uniref:Tripartite-type tricarboxylate transporter receptor subunit TctC n=1 Tax=Roseococcus suduntuyensis TaxID=455361 RepID=A0A840AB11_9PROT|nr:tripartite tricarboxylate transporter substrate binding protein [Roseococcus suduntuyensis]MBB3897454.1 tripartite-type tricarboxylate transporter receptor subunit TctC [Roseococcus suduntuyensis]
MTIIRAGGISRRGTFMLGAAGAASLATPAIGQSPFPNRPIRLICPWTPGGSTDMQMRAIAEIASRKLGQPISIENRPGAGGVIGPQAVAQAQPDGYTLGQLPISVFRHPQMVQRPLFNPLEDFTYVIHLTGYLFGTVVRADSPIRTHQELIERAKAQPGRLSYGSPGVGTSLHITMEQIALAADAEFLHVPFRGFAENIAALLGGQIDVLADSSGWAPLALDGRVRVLAVWGRERAKRFPDVPTLQEVGVPVVSASPYGFGGPKGIPAEIVAKLHDAFKEALEDRAHLDVLDRYDMLPWYMNSEDYAAFARRTFEEEGVMIRRLNLRI